MFIELNTIWKTIKDSFPDPYKGNSSNHDGPALSDKEFSQWSRRRIGVLFSKKNGVWTFIVLLAPEKEGVEIHGKGKKSGDENRKGFLHLHVVENSNYDFANAHSENGELVYCAESRFGIENMINFVAMQLKKVGPTFLTSLLQDVFWGWEEFLKQMRLPILEVISLFAAHSHTPQ